MEAQMQLQAWLLFVQDRRGGLVMGEAKEHDV